MRNKSFGKMGGTILNASAVPEPTTLGLFAACGMALALRQRRRS